MNLLVIDIGNTRIKLGVFFESVLILHDEIILGEEAKIKNIIDAYQVAHVLVSDVSGKGSQINQLLQEVAVLQLNHQTKLPFNNRYKSGETLGADRLALVAGAMHFYDKSNCLVIDAGTCITYDLLTVGGDYLGGNISPGLQMRLKAMHNFTGKLPLPQWREPSGIMGQDTESCLLTGAYFGLVGEISYFIDRYDLDFNDLKVVLSGGDAALLAKPIKKSIFVHEHLLLYGLNKILIENVK